MTTGNQCMQLLYEHGLLKNTVIALHPTIHSQYVIRLALKKKQTKKKPAPLVIQIKIHICTSSMLLDNVFSTVKWPINIKP